MTLPCQAPLPWAVIQACRKAILDSQRLNGETKALISRSPAPVGSIGMAGPEEWATGSASSLGLKKGGVWLHLWRGR